MGEKLDLEDANVFCTEMTVEEARNTDGLPSAVGVALDEAQAHVFGGEGTKAYLVIEITKD